MLGKVDLPHPAGTQQPQHAVPGERVTDPKRHGRMLTADMQTLDASSKSSMGDVALVLPMRATTQQAESSATSRPTYVVYFETPGSSTPGGRPPVGLPVPGDNARKAANALVPSLTIPGGDLDRGERTDARSDRQGIFHRIASRAAAVRSRWKPGTQLVLG